MKQKIFQCALFGIIAVLLAAHTSRTPASAPLAKLQLKHGGAFVYTQIRTPLDCPSSHTVCMIGKETLQKRQLKTGRYYRIDYLDTSTLRPVKEQSQNTASQRYQVFENWQKQRAERQHASLRYETSLSKLLSFSTICNESETEHCLFLSNTVPAKTTSTLQSTLTYIEKPQTIVTLKTRHIGSKQKKMLSLIVYGLSKDTPNGLYFIQNDIALPKTIEKQCQNERLALLKRGAHEDPFFQNKIAPPLEVACYQKQLENNRAMQAYIEAQEETLAGVFSLAESS